MQVTVYGDSILKGVLLENGKYTVSHEWEQKLSERFGLRVTNRCRFGSTLPKAMARIEKDSETAGDGEFALLEFGGNDCDYDWAAIADAPEGEHQCKTPPQLFLTCYRRAIRLLRESGRKPVLSTLPPINAELYLGFLCRNGLSRENIVRWLGDVQRIYRWQENYSQMAEQLAREENAPLIDLRRPFLQDSRSPATLLCADGIHPSRVGQELIYDSFCAVL
ncbi:MAG: SGNH/GDSL hydrolase family protein [Oscillospiraceae bacterium]|nr:SGNH/GDSL hydrolase family protein [Oscillospiraceae bacterium]